MSPINTPSPTPTPPPKTKTKTKTKKNPNWKSQSKATLSPPALYRQIRALHTPATITVYQAYPESIALPALAAQSFANIPAFKMSRMTWIKPSFLWMAYRSGYGTKRGQERVLAVEISRAGFEWAVARGVLAHLPSTTTTTTRSSRSSSTAASDPAGGGQAGTQDRLAQWRANLEASCVRVQWDPERDLFGNPLPYRSLQVGLRGEAVERYVSEWTVGIRDVTGLMHEIKGLVDEGDLEGARGLVPTEAIYDLPTEIRRGVGMVEA
ncbi:hypothetical protein BJX64DRAFT_272082 [Aspergillus heterothallicus]